LNTNWAQISQEIRTRELLHNGPKPLLPTQFESLAKQAIESMDVREEVIRRTLVGGKYLFITREQ